MTPKEAAITELAELIKRIASDEITVTKVECQTQHDYITYQPFGENLVHKYKTGRGYGTVTIDFEKGRTR